MIKPAELFLSKVLKLYHLTCEAKSQERKARAKESKYSPASLKETLYVNGTYLKEQLLTIVKDYLF